MTGRKFALLFPGQGSQTLGMLSNFLPVYPQIKQTFAHVSLVLDYDLWELSQTGPQTQLDQTEFTQPLLLTASIALWEVWQIHCQAKPALLAGHSLGEYTALVVAGCLDLITAVKLVADRGRFMQQAAAQVKPEQKSLPMKLGSHNYSAMGAIIGLSNKEVEEICRQAAQGSIVGPANYNAPGQVVIAGEKAAVERALTLAKQKAKLVKLLPISIAAHCELMRPAAIAMQKLLSQITLKPPIIPFINNVDVQIHTDPNLIKEALIKQLYSPVRWTETIQYMEHLGMETVLECGPNKVLVGLHKRISQIPSFPLSQPESMSQACQYILGDQ